MKRQYGLAGQLLKIYIGPTIRKIHKLGTIGLFDRRLAEGRYSAGKLAGV